MLLGLRHPNSVSTYQRRYPDMPKPVLDLGPGRPKLWLRPHVERMGRDATKEVTQPIKSNDPCWCGSGRKYKRCHQAAGAGASGQGHAADATCPLHIPRPDYAEQGRPLRRGRADGKEQRDHRAHANGGPDRGRGAPGHRRRHSSRRHDRRARRDLPRGHDQPRGVPEPAQLPRVPEVDLHLGQRGHLSRDTRLTPFGRG